jgi:signal transduction histidine kinase
VLDEHGVVTDTNAAAGRILGHTPRRLVGKPLPAMVDLADRRELRRHLLRLSETGEVRTVVHLGEAEWHLALRVVPQVTPRAIVAALTTERAPEPPPPRTGALEQQLLLLRFSLATVAFDRELRVVFANAAARHLFGARAVRGGEILDLGALAGFRPLLERLTTVAAPLRPTVVNVSAQQALRVHGIAATSEQPAVLFAEDVSDELQHERVMREFLRNAAHQLRTPLAGITAAVETLQGGAKDHPADRDRFLAHVERHAERLSRIARGLLLLARAETGEPVAIDFVEVKPLLADIVAQAEPRDGVAVRSACPPGLAALGTPDLLREALAALVDNAVSHTYEGEVSVKAIRQDGHVLVSVTDSGAGILPEFQDRIFEPFFRVTPSGEGYGLGLAIAAQAVRAMRGEIGVSSMLGAGTTFTVTLPSATVIR